MRTASTDRRYYAVQDPDNPEQMTYWYTGKRDLEAWPPKARYGPVIRITLEEAPEDDAERLAWCERVYAPARHYRFAIEAAIQANPVAAGQRFAQFASRCCVCGRTLTDNLSKCYGIGPECRAGIDTEVLARYYTPAVARAHAEDIGQEAAS